MMVEREERAVFALKDKVAIVTGGGSGIGRAIVDRFAEAGVRLVIADISDQSLLAEQIAGRFVETDVSSDEAVESLVADAIGHFGRLDVLVNNAGIALDDIDADVTEVTDDVYRRIFDVNALGVAHGVKHAARRMDDGGSIVNISSLAGVIGFPGLPAYSMSKAAIIGLTRSAAMELAPRIRVNAVCPGFVDTPMADRDSVDYSVFSRNAVPMARLARPEEIAAVVHFLASDDAGVITGQALNVGGGLSAGVSLGVVRKAFEADRDD